MGGEPDNDDIGTVNSFSTVGISSYKAPVLITAHPMDADDELLDEPPTVERNISNEQHLSTDVLGEFSSCVNIIENVNVENKMDDELKSLSVHTKSSKTLKIPKIRSNYYLNCIKNSIIFIS